jgi:two-component system OmpR family response regulator
MSAAAIHDLETAAGRRGLSHGRSAAPASSASAPAGVPPGAVVVTVQIAVSGDELSPAAARLLADLTQLAGMGRSELRVQPGPEVAGAPVPATRPRLVRTPAPGGPEVLVCPASRTVYRDGEPVRLTRREFDLLAFLCASPRRVFSRSQLLRQVWGYEPVSGERTVDVHVRRLRVKLGDEGYPVVATVRGVGYRLAEGAQLRTADINE